MQQIWNAKQTDCFLLISSHGKHNRFTNPITVVEFVHSLPKNLRWFALLAGLCGKRTYLLRFPLGLEEGTCDILWLIIAVCLEPQASRWLFHHHIASHHIQPFFFMAGPWEKHRVFHSKAPGFVLLSEPLPKHLQDRGVDLRLLRHGHA